MSRLKYILILLLFVIDLSSQTLDLPRELTPEERQVIESGQYVFPAREGAFYDPEGPMRSMAEWEEIQAVAITWTSYRPILAQIISAIKEECIVIIVCNDSLSVQSYLNINGVDWSSNVSFVEAPYNSVWIRDYGPNTVYLNDVDKLMLVDWLYNRPRPLDDMVSGHISQLLDIEMLSTTNEPDDLVHTGGNFMSDGMGTGFSSRLVLDENGPFNNWGVSNHNEADIDNIMFRYMGVKEYPKMTNLPWDAIHHIDMHMKLLDEETLLVGYYPEGVADGPQINANIDYILSNFKTPFGNDYIVHRIDMPPDHNGRYPDAFGDYRTYANALISNNTIIVPTYEEKYDTTALRIWRELMPGYNIVGINCNSIIPANGALHCITKEVGVADPILINMPKTVDACTDEETELFALIKSKSNLQEVLLHYRIKGEHSYTSIPMVLEDEELGRWTSNIDAFSEKSTIEYYVSVQNSEGKVINRPFVAPEGYWTYKVKDCQSTSVDFIDEDVRDVNIYPNPSSSITCIKINSETPSELRISITDLVGRDLKTVHNGSVKIGENRFFFDASVLPRGFYCINIESPRGMISKKLMVQ